MTKAQQVSINQKIREYLDGKLDYNVGLSLFIQITKNKVLIRTLVGLESDKKREILKYQLNKYLENEETISKDSDRMESKQPQFIEANDSIPRKTSERSTLDFPWTNSDSNSSDFVSREKSILIQLTERRALLYRKRGNIHNDMFHAVKDERRYELAVIIMNLSAEIDEIHRDLRNFEKGKVPEKYIKKTQDASVYVKITNLKSYIRKYEGFLKRDLDKSQREHYEKLLQIQKDKLKTMIDGN